MFAKAAQLFASEAFEISIFRSKKSVSRSSPTPAPRIPLRERGGQGTPSGTPTAGAGAGVTTSWQSHAIKVAWHG